MSLPRYYCPKCKTLIALNYEDFIERIKRHAEANTICKNWFLKEQKEWERRHGKTPAPSPPAKLTPENTPADPNSLERRVLRGMRKPKGEEAK